MFVKGETIINLTQKFFVTGESVIEHPGTVEKILEDRIIVHLLAPPACGSCHAKGACGMTDSEEKIIEVFQPGKAVSEGDTVMVVLNKTLGFRALFLGYVIPLLILLITVFLFSELLGSEAFGALSALMLVGIYYIILYFSREKIETQFKFSLRKPI